MQLFFLVAGRRETVFRRELAAESSSLGIFSRDPTTNAAYVTLEELGGTVVASWQPVSMHRCWKDLRARASLAISSRQDVCELYYKFIYTCHDYTHVFPRAENANWKDRECCPIGTLNLFAFEIWIDVLHLLTQIILIYSTLERKIVRNKESNIRRLDSVLLPSTEGSDLTVEESYLPLPSNFYFSKLLRPVLKLFRTNRDSNPLTTTISET